MAKKPGLNPFLQVVVFNDLTPRRALLFLIRVLIPSYRSLSSIKALASQLGVSQPMSLNPFLQVVVFN